MPVIAVTASVMQHDRKQITAAGFDAYVGKPINIKEFLDYGAKRPRVQERRVMSAPAKVLVVDDTPNNVKLLADLLAVKGYAVATAGNGEEALAKIASERPDLVLLDVMMPGLSGYDVCRRIRAEPATALLPVVLVTSLDPMQERVQRHRRRRRRLPVQADQPARAVRTRALAAAGQIAAGRGWAPGRRAQGVESLSSSSASTSRWRSCSGSGSSSASFRRMSPTRSSRPASSRSSPRIDARSRTYSSTCAGSRPLPMPPSPRRSRRCCANTTRRWGGIASEYDATVDRFAGDGILIFFNDPLPISEPGKRAATMALAMQARFAPLRERWSTLGYNLDLGIGIAQGFATLGAFGYEGRWDYSAIGGVVNLASRLSDEAHSGQILIDRRTRAALGEAAEVEPVGPLALKGYAQPVSAYILKRIAA